MESSPREWIEILHYPTEGLREGEADEERKGTVKAFQGCGDILYHLLMLGASQGERVVKSPPANAGDLRDSGLTPGLGRSPGGGHGNPLQYSCMENPKDRGAWWATVHGVTKSQSRSDLAAAAAATCQQKAIFTNVQVMVTLTVVSPKSPASRSSTKIKPENGITTHPGVQAKRHCTQWLHFFLPALPFLSLLCPSFAVKFIP